MTFIKHYLLTPGPTPLPDTVRAALSRPAVYHRSPEFLEALEETENHLAEVFGTKNKVLVFAASGTGAMESAVENLLGRNEQALLLSAGKFGERWGEIIRAQGKTVSEKKFSWGEKINLEKSKSWLEKQSGSVMFLTLSETSTGVIHDVEEIISWAKQQGMLVVLDAISALGTMPMPEADVIVSGSQKALAVPPGLALVSLSPAAEEKARSISAGFYWSWVKALDKKPGSPFTPATHLVFALQASLRLMTEEGLPAVWKRHETLAMAARAGGGAIGLPLFAEGFSPVLTSFRLPEGKEKLVQEIRDELGVTLAGGQEELRGKIVRLAHCGYFGAFDILIGLSALEIAFASPGQAVAAAEKILMADTSFAL